MKQTTQRSALLFFAIFVFYIGPAAHNIFAQKTSPTLPCKCPLLEVTTHFTSVQSGDVVEFTVASKDGQTETTKYNWKVSGGKIISGQGTAIIRVRASNEIFRNTVSASVAADYGRACICASASKTVKVGRRTIIANSPANVTSLMLDETELTTPCSPGTLPVSGKASVDMVIDISTEAEDKENDVLVYEYTVTGGRIIGSGSKVKWDLTEATPGSYLITASVDDGCGFCGRVITKSVTVRDCKPK